MKTIRLALASLAVLALPACTGGGQPRMHEALETLRDARAQLESAEPDKGGHRERAIAAVDKAIEETRAGIEFARK